VTVRIVQLAVAVMALIAVSLSAQTGSRAKPVLGAGSTLCSTWNGSSKLTHNPDGRNTVTASPKDPVLVSWVLGYLSAAGVGGRAAQPGGTDYALGWISGRCMNQPELTLAAAAAEVVANYPHTSN
jgi:hypothetical protein